MYSKGDEKNVIDFVKNQSLGYKAVLGNNIKSKGKSAMFGIVAGALLMLATLAAAAIIACGKNSPYWCTACCCIISVPVILAAIGAIVLLMAFGSSLKQADYYRNEITVLNNLNMALQICESIPDTDIEKTDTKERENKDKHTKEEEVKDIHKQIIRKTRVKEQIIEAILNRCSS